MGNIRYLGEWKGSHGSYLRVQLRFGLQLTMT